MWQITLKFLISSACGFLIGIEREKSHKAVGLRTCMLVCCSMTLFMILNQELSMFFNGRCDILRLPAYTILSIGFLGSGIIRQNKKHVEGVTTACVLFMLVGIGLSVGIEKYLLAVMFSIFTYGILKLKYIEKWFQ